MQQCVPSVDKRWVGCTATDAEDFEAVTELSKIVLNQNASPEQIFVAVFGIRKRLSKEREPPIDMVLRAGEVVQRMVQIMIHIEDPEFEAHLMREEGQPSSLAHKTRFECAWALTNV